MPARGRRPTAAMPQPVVVAPGPVTSRPPAPPGWLAGSPKTAWKTFEECGEDDLWAEEIGTGKYRRKVVKIECRHKRRDTGKPARAVVRGEDDHLDEVYRFALIVPCQYTQCPQWVASHPNEVR